MRSIARGLAFSALCLCVCSAPLARAQQAPPGSSATAYLAPEFLAVVTVRPKVLMLRPEMAPLAGIIADFQKQSGVDFRQVDEAVGFLGPGLILSEPDGAGGVKPVGPTAAVILRAPVFDQRHILQVSFPAARELASGQIRYFGAPDPEDGGVYFPDTRTIVTAAQQAMLPKMFAVQTASGPLAEVWQRSNRGALANVVFASAPVRRLAADLQASKSPAAVSAELLANLGLFDELEISVANDFSMQISLRCRDKVDAEKLLLTANANLKSALTVADAQLAELQDVPEKLRHELELPLQLQRTLLGGLKPQQDGANVVARIDAARGQVCVRAAAQVIADLIRNQE